jgi:branched-chain amino acid transport system substrate-binding protein
VLGSVGVESGLLGGALAPAVAAARAWAAAVNARGGIGGRPVRVIFGDDGGNPNQALALVRRMVEQDKVVAFYAFRMPTTMEAVVAYLDGAQVPVIGTCVCDTAFGRSEMVFNPGGVSGLTGLVWEHILPVTSQTDRRRAALLTCREAAVCTALGDGVAQLAPKAGLTIVYRGQMSIAQPDFTAEMIAARNAGADTVIAVSENATLIRMARSAHRQNYRPLFVGTHSSHQDSFLTSGGEDVEGAVVAASVPDYGTSPKLADYRTAMQRFAPGAPRGSLGAQAWVAGKMIEHLVALVGERPVHAKTIVDALYSLRNETLDGLLPPTTYVPDEGHDLTAQCVVGLIIEHGRYVAPRGDDYVCAPGWQPVTR